MVGLLLLPRSDRASKYTYAFIAHETAHQWWGNIVAWRSYRDQWLSEGFAEYSGILYTALRAKPKAARELIEDLRRSLKNPPRTTTGIGPGRLVDVGPGHRLWCRDPLRNPIAGEAPQSGTRSGSLDPVRENIHKGALDG
ncbi:MAG: M1 family aminopeptidase [Acidobacteriota bacterium]